MTQDFARRKRERDAAKQQQNAKRASRPNKPVPRKKKKGEEKPPLPAWALLAMGAVFGGFVAGIYQLANLETPIPTPQASETLAKPVSHVTSVDPAETSAPTQKTDASPTDQTAKRAPAKPAAEPSKTAAQPKANTDTSDKSPEFEFYSLLETAEVVVDTPDKDTKAATKTKDYYLQAGSFKEHKEAERIRAEIILLGHYAQIESSVNKEGATWHRVIAGPFTSRTKMAELRSNLAAKGLSPMMIQRDISARPKGYKPTTKTP